MYKKLSLIPYLIAAIFVFTGMYKMYVYEYSEYSPEDSVNAYVGGDAYNFIINANYATAYFVLALICVLIGTTLVIMGLFQDYKVLKHYYHDPEYLKHLNLNGLDDNISEISHNSQQ